MSRRARIQAAERRELEQIYEAQSDWREELPPEEHKFKGDMTHENHADNGALARAPEIRSSDWSIYVEEIS